MDNYLKISSIIDEFVDLLHVALDIMALELKYVD